MALGDCELTQDDPYQQIRYYWNIEASGAAPLMRLLTTRLNQQRIPFRFKVIADEASYVRTDAGVLYAHRCDLAAVSAVVEECYLHLGPRLKPLTPAFTQEIAAGVGFAESPPDPAESFGTARCEVLAEAILRAHEASATGLDERMAVVETCFVEHGLQLDAPYLNAVTVDNPAARVS
jgi:hypothetical protein